MVHVACCSFGTIVAYRQLIFGTHWRMSALYSVINLAFLCEFATPSIATLSLASSDLMQIITLVLEEAVVMMCTAESLDVLHYVEILNTWWIGLLLQ